jgi:hypothetical protein
VVTTPIIIDDALRLVLARLEGLLGVYFIPSEIERVFSDATLNQRDEKDYTFFESSRVRVTGHVEEYEPETIEISILAPHSLGKRCNEILKRASGSQA